MELIEKNTVLVCNDVVLLFVDVVVVVDVVCWLVLKMVAWLKERRFMCSLAR